MVQCSVDVGTWYYVVQTLPVRVIVQKHLPIIRHLHSE